GILVQNLLVSRSTAEAAALARAADGRAQPFRLVSLRDHESDEPEANHELKESDNVKQPLHSTNSLSAIQGWQHGQYTMPRAHAVATSRPTAHATRFTSCMSCENFSGNSD